MQSIDDKILANIKKCGRGKVYFVADFALYGEANSVQKALERLVKSQTFLRLARGIYYYPKMDKDFAIKAISNDELWNTIRHHREKFTHINGVDYSQDIRSKISLVPPEQVIDNWQQDYEAMQNSMFYGNSLTFNELIERIKQLEERIRQRILPERVVVI